MKLSAKQKQAIQVYEEKQDHFHLRVPKGMLEKYTKLAKSQGKSLNAYIVEMLNDEIEINKLGGGRNSRANVLESKIVNLQKQRDELQKEIDSLDNKKKELYKLGEYIVEKLK